MWDEEGVPTPGRSGGDPIRREVLVRDRWVEGEKWEWG